MKADYQTAITEYEQALEDTRVRDEDSVRVIGLLGIMCNGLVSQEKAVEMLVQNKDLPVILSNLGMAYGGLGEYQEAITMLQQAAILKPAARTYMYGARNRPGAGGQDAGSDRDLRQNPNGGPHGQKRDGGLLQKHRHRAHE